MCLLLTTVVEMEKLLQIGKEFGLEGEKLLEFVEKQQKLEEKRRREEEEKEEKRRQIEEEKEERRRILEEPEVKNSYQYVFELREKLEDTLKLAHRELEKAQQKGKHYYDLKSKVRKFQPGEKVLVLLP